MELSMSTKANCFYRDCRFLKVVSSHVLLQAVAKEYENAPCA